MEVIVHKVSPSKYAQIDSFFPQDDVLFFDIETTGFIAKTSMLYLIGCAFVQSGQWYIKQWFNDDGESEEIIIRDFLATLKSYKYLLHYNGDGFDLPFLMKKLPADQKENPFEQVESIDIYKQIRSLKDILHLQNMKQKTVETFLNVKRLDKYTGGDLIKVYQDYLKQPQKNAKQLLLQHNYEDLQGLMDCTSLLAYTRLKAGCLQVRRMSVRQNRLLFSLSLDYSIPRRMTLGIHDIIITGYQHEATLNVPILSEELKFFFDNYKEYYYLPAEDMAVHKSVASYVDKNYRTPATKETCYLRKNGYFITQVDSGILTGYKRNVSDKETFIELADSFLQDINMLNAYARHIIRLALS